MNGNDLTLDEYQKRAIDTAIYPDIGKNLPYAIMALCGEAGELANKVKKLIRSYGFKQGESFHDLVKRINNLPENTKKMREHKKFGIELVSSLNGELGGVLWYVADTAYEMHTQLHITAEENLHELSNRVKNDTQEGSGDTRGNQEG